MELIERTMGLMLIFGIFCLLHSAESTCTFPSGLEGTWISSNNGEVIINSTHMSYAVYARGNLLFECHLLSGTKYILKSEEFALFSSSALATVCIEFELLKTGLYRYLVYTSELADANYQRVKYTATSTTITEAVSCDDISNTEAIILMESGSIATVKTQCPDILLGTFSYTFNETDCVNDTAIMDVCTDTSTLTFNYTTCSTEQAYSSNGSVNCIYYSTSGTTTTVYAYNLDATTDETNYYQFTCYMLESNGGLVYATQYPQFCDSSQTATSVEGPGATMNMTASVTCVPSTATSATTAASVSSAGLLGGVIAGLLALIIVGVIIGYVVYRKKYKKERVEPRKGLPPTSTGQDESDDDKVDHDVEEVISISNENKKRRPKMPSRDDNALKVASEVPTIARERSSAFKETSKPRLRIGDGTVRPTAKTKVKFLGTNKDKMVDPNETKNGASAVEISINNSEKDLMKPTSNSDSKPDANHFLPNTLHDDLTVDTYWVQTAPVSLEICKSELKNDKDDEIETKSLYRGLLDNIQDGITDEVGISKQTPGKATSLMHFLKTNIISKGVENFFRGITGKLKTHERDKNVLESDSKLAIQDVPKSDIRETPHISKTNKLQNNNVETKHDSEIRITEKKLEIGINIQIKTSKVSRCLNDEVSSEYKTECTKTSKNQNKSLKIVNDEITFTEERSMTDTQLMKSGIKSNPEEADSGNNEEDCHTNTNERKNSNEKDDPSMTKTDLNNTIIQEVSSKQVLSEGNKNEQIISHKFCFAEIDKRRAATITKEDSCDEVNVNETMGDGGARSAIITEDTSLNAKNDVICNALKVTNDVSGIGDNRNRSVCMTSEQLSINKSEQPEISSLNTSLELKESSMNFMGGNIVTCNVQETTSYINVSETGDNSEPRVYMASGQNTSIELKNLSSNMTGGNIQCISSLTREQHSPGKPTALNEIFDKGIYPNRIENVVFNKRDPDIYHSGLHTRLGSATEKQTKMLGKEMCQENQHQIIWKNECLERTEFGNKLPATTVPLIPNPEAVHKPEIVNKDIFPFMRNDNELQFQTNIAPIKTQLKDLSKDERKTENEVYRPDLVSSDQFNQNKTNDPNTICSGNKQEQTTLLHDVALVQNADVAPLSCEKNDSKILNTAVVVKQSNADSHTKAQIHESKTSDKLSYLIKSEAQRRTTKNKKNNIDVTTSLEINSSEPLTSGENNTSNSERYESRVQEELISSYINSENTLNDNIHHQLTSEEGMHPRNMLIEDFDDSEMEDDDISLSMPRMLALEHQDTDLTILYKSKLKRKRKNQIKRIRRDDNEQSQILPNDLDGTRRSHILLNEKPSSQVYNKSSNFIQKSDSILIQRVLDTRYCYESEIKPSSKPNESTNLEHELIPWKSVDLGQDQNLDKNITISNVPKPLNQKEKKKATKLLQVPSSVEYQSGLEYAEDSSHNCPEQTIEIATKETKLPTLHSQETCKSLKVDVTSKSSKVNVDKKITKENIHCDVVLPSVVPSKKSEWKHLGLSETQTTNSQDRNESSHLPDIDNKELKTGKTSNISLGNKERVKKTGKMCSNQKLKTKKAKKTEKREKRLNRKDDMNNSKEDFSEKKEILNYDRFGEKEEILREAKPNKFRFDQLPIVRKETKNKQPNTKKIEIENKSGSKLSSFPSLAISHPQSNMHSPKKVQSSDGKDVDDKHVESVDVDINDHTMQGLPKLQKNKKIRRRKPVKRNKSRTVRKAVKAQVTDTEESDDDLDWDPSKYLDKREAGRSARPSTSSDLQDLILKIRENSLILSRASSFADLSSIH